MAAIEILKPRLRYAHWIGLILWIGWGISILTGSGRTDRAGQVIGADYLQFYAAGTTLNLGEQKRLYDFPFQSQLEQQILGPELLYFHAYLNPPFLAILYSPLARLPYLISFAVWSLLGIFFLWGGIRCLNVPPSSWPYCISFFPVFAAFTFGQNSLLSFALLAASTRLWEKRPLLSGLIASLVAYKPQLLLGVALFGCFDGRRGLRFLTGLGAGAGTLALVCFAFFPEASNAYLDFSLHIMPRLPEWYDFPTWQLHTLRGFWRLLLPGIPQIADGITAIFSLIVIREAIQLWKNPILSLPLQLAVAHLLTLAITPHAMIYDWTLLLLPAFLLWNQLPSLQEKLFPLFSLLFVGALIANPLTQLQLKFFPSALQIAIPIFAYLLWKLRRALTEPR